MGDPLRTALNDAILEAMTLGSTAGVDETMRKWVMHARVSDDHAGLAAQLAEATALACELSIYAPSFSGVRPVDRLARVGKDRTGDAALAPDLLRRARFTLFRIEAREGDGLFRARDLAADKTFTLYEPRLAPSALELDLAARLCAIPQGLHVLVGPMLPLGAPGASTAREYCKPGCGLGNDQRCAALVYRDHIRRNAGLGPNFGLKQDREPVRLSHIDPDLCEFAAYLYESGEGPQLTGDALAQARGLASPIRILSALSCSVELRRGGDHPLAAIYRSLAAIQLETLCERSRVGSGERDALEKLRATLAERVAKRGLHPEALALFDELAGPLRPAARARAAEGDDLSRVIERIRALRAKTTEQGCTEQEALRAAEKVAEMLERYGLSLSEIELRKQTCEGFGLDTGRRKREPSDRCVPAIAEYCDCRSWSEMSAIGTIRNVFFGLPADVEAAHYLYDLVAVTFDTETQAFKRGELYGAMYGAGRRAAASSFQIGLADGISRKLRQLKLKRQAAAFKSSGRDLMPIKASILDAEMEKLGLAFKSRSGRRRRRVISAAFREGQAAGGKFEARPGLK